LSRKQYSYHSHSIRNDNTNWKFHYQILFYLLTERMSHKSDHCNFCPSSVSQEMLQTLPPPVHVSPRLLSQFCRRKLFIAAPCRRCAIAVPRHTIVNFSHQAQKGCREGVAGGGGGTARGGEGAKERAVDNEQTSTRTYRWKG